MFTTSYPTTIEGAHKGVEPCKSTLIHNLTPLASTSVSLEAEAFSRLNSSFDSFGHKPSEEMLKALKAVLESMSDMANGSASSDVRGGPVFQTMLQRF